MLLGVGYVAMFANSTAGYAKPAHAIIAVFHPNQDDLRDTSSNLYRTVENFDLKYTIQHNNFLFGVGFGKPYLQPIPLTTLFQNIQSVDIYYNYVPHNNIYWAWMRLGAIGFLVFWFLIGSIIVRGSTIARQLRDRYLQLVAIYTVAITIMEIIVAYADYQLFFYRNVIYLGLLAGILMKLPELDKEEARV
jgi:O-antigen ligase